MANILADLELDLVTVICGLLHDVRRHPVTDEIEEEFGEEVAYLVDGVTKLSRMEFCSKEEHQAETWRKMFIAMAKDIRVILIKLADRTHNMRTLRYLKGAKQKEIARETLEIYAPLAHRLGIYKIKWELDDLAFVIWNPSEYYNLVDKLSMKRKEREEFINNMIAILQEKIDEARIPAEISGRPKHIYGIYHKMKSQGKDFSEIYDLTAVRIIVESIRSAMGRWELFILGVLIPGHFNDYIAMPSQICINPCIPRLYALKTGCWNLQIRTKEMHRTAEYGIAAHWKYKEKVKDDREFEESFPG